MSVLDGPRREVRRVVHKGRVHHCRPEADVLVLDDGTTIDEASAMYVSPVDARTIVCVHLNYPRGPWSSDASSKATTPRTS